MPHMPPHGTTDSGICCSLDNVCTCRQFIKAAALAIRQGPQLCHTP